MLRLTGKIFFLATMLLCVSAMSFAQTDYDRLEAKAQRFFDNSEWANANAMYVLMLEQKPQEATTYADAIVSNIMAGDNDHALALLTSAMSYEIPFETLLGEIRTTSFSIGRGDLYEKYLLDVKKSYPWLSRIVDNYLMQYYAFRQNGPEIIKYAETMLAGLPDNLSFLRMLAYGKLLTGDNEGAEKTWMKVISLYPDDYDTILDLANYFDTIGNTESALNWMQRAEAIRSTPYVTGRIAALTGPRIK